VKRDQQRQAQRARQGQRIASAACEMSVNQVGT
jgi:hypothetical protein